MERELRDGCTSEVTMEAGKVGRAEERYSQDKERYRNVIGNLKAGLRIA